MFIKHLFKSCLVEVVQPAYTNTWEQLKKQSLQSKKYSTIMCIFAH